MAHETTSVHAFTVRLSIEEKQQLLERSRAESRPISQMARLLILQSLKSEGNTSQQHSTSVAAG